MVETAQDRGKRRPAHLAIPRGWKDLRNAYMDMVSGGSRRSLCASDNGKNSRWYKAAMQQKAGRISAAAMTKEVIFEAVNGAINDRIDEVYKTKYRAARILPR